MAARERRVVSFSEGVTMSQSLLSRHEQVNRANEYLSAIVSALPAAGAPKRIDDVLKTAASSARAIPSDLTSVLGAAVANGSIGIDYSAGTVHRTS